MWVGAPPFRPGVTPVLGGPSCAPEPDEVLVGVAVAWAPVQGPLLRVQPRLSFREGPHFQLWFPWGGQCPLPWSWASGEGWGLTCDLAPPPAPTHQLLEAPGGIVRWLLAMSV